ncbi:MAG: hypothetical protein ACP5FX_02955, partial [Candidatus Micrarchaeia archaeon]
ERVAEEFNKIVKEKIADSEFRSKIKKDLEEMGVEAYHVVFFKERDGSEDVWRINTQYGNYRIGIKINYSVEPVEEESSKSGKIRE